MYVFGGWRHTPNCMPWPADVLHGDASIALAMYMAFGCLAYRLLEHWMLIDTVYFLLVACTTVGYGDYVPHTDIAKVFTAVYVPIGTVVLFRACYQYAQLVHATLTPVVGTVGNGRCGNGPARLSQPDDEDGDMYDYMRAALGPALYVAALSVLATLLLKFSYADSFYFASTSVALIGFGDLAADTAFTPIEKYSVAALLVLGSMQTLFAVEQAYLIYSRRQIKSMPLSRLIEQVILQESCWDSKWGSDEHVLLSKARCATLPCPALPYPTLPYPTLPYPILPHPTSPLQGQVPRARIRDRTHPRRHSMRPAP